VGDGLVTPTHCFWDTQASGQPSGSYGTGKTTAQMKTRKTFTDAAWNFTTIWGILENVTYPFLQWQDTGPPVADAGPDQAVDEDLMVTFNASASTDDFGVADYAWNLTDGGPVQLKGR